MIETFLRLFRPGPGPRAQAPAERERLRAPDWVRAHLGDDEVSEALDAIDLDQCGNRLAAERKMARVLARGPDPRRREFQRVFLSHLDDSAQRGVAARLFASHPSTPTRSLIDADASDLAECALERVLDQVRREVDAACSAVLRQGPDEPADALRDAYYEVIFSCCRCSDAEQLALSDLGLKRCARRPIGDAASAGLEPTERALCRVVVGIRPLLPEQIERLAEAHFTFWEYHRAIGRALAQLPILREERQRRQADLRRRLKSAGRSDEYVEAWLANDPSLQRLAAALIRTRRILRGEGGPEGRPRSM